MQKFLNKSILFLIKIYKLFFSFFFGNNCRFYPSCSSYAEDAIKLHGIKLGIALTLKRVFKCHPLKILGGKSGVDFVPDKKEIKNG